MTGWPVLDVVIGLSFLFFVLSIVCSSINEGIASVLNWRAKTLEQWIGSVLSDPSQLDRVKPAIQQVLTDAQLPTTVDDALAGAVAAAVADTSNTVKEVKAQITVALKKARIPTGKLTGLADKVFEAADEARKAPPADVPSDIRIPASAKANAFFGHPAVQPLIKPSRSGTTAGGRRPSYIPSSTFATVLLNQATGGHASNATAGEVIARLPSVIGAAVSDIGHTVSNVAADGTADLVALRKKIEQWYDTSMQRVAGWYKRKVQLALAIIALVVSVGLNADSFGIANSLWSDTTVRSAIVANAGRTVANSSQVPTTQSITSALDNVHQLNLPLGWGRQGTGSWNVPGDFGSWLSKIGGILLTTFALTLGAPFWFDVLGRLFQIKGTGAKPPSTLDASGAGTMLTLIGSPTTAASTNGAGTPATLGGTVPLVPSVGTSGTAQANG